MASALLLSSNLAPILLVWGNLTTVEDKEKKKVHVSEVAVMKKIDVRLEDIVTFMSL